MLRSLGHREDGYEIFEVTSLDDLDFASLVPMMDRAWKVDYADQARLDFDEAVLRKMMPGSFWVAVLACSSDGAPVGFELAVERTLRVREQTLHAYYASVFTVCADHRRKGLGRWILEAINQLVFTENEADVIVSTFHEGHAGSPAVQSTFDRISRWGVERFHSSAIWSRQLDREPLAPLESPLDFVRLGGPGEGPPADASALDDLTRAGFETSFALDTSLGAQYLNPAAEASGAHLYELGSERRCLVCFNVVPLKINDRQLRPIGQLQFLLAPGCSEAEIEKVVHQMGLFLADRGCFALTLVDMGMIPRGVLESLGFSPTEGLITFAARGPKSTIAAFDGLSPPFFVDFM